MVGQRRSLRDTFKNERNQDIAKSQKNIQKMIESKKRMTAFISIDNKLDLHLKNMQQNNEEISNEMRNNNTSDVKRKSQAAYRTSGE